jgi:hypothetical protein
MGVTAKKCNSNDKNAAPLDKNAALNAEGFEFVPFLCLHLSF